MKVVILCGGQGTRLREETEYRPKPMVPIGNRPILWHIMKIYAHWGHRDFILCLGYKGHLIRDYFFNYHWTSCDVTFSLGRTPAVQYHDRHGEEDWNVTLVDTGDEAGTAYRVRQTKRFIPPDEPFLLTYGDGLANIDINSTIRAHTASGKICTISAVHPAGRFGSLAIDEMGIIHTFQEKPQMEKEYVNGGFMVCDYATFNYLPDDPKLMFEREPIMNLTREGQLHSCRHEGFWQPMDTYQEMQYLNRLWAEGQAPWKIW